MRLEQVTVVALEVLLLWVSFGGVASQAQKPSEFWIYYRTYADVGGVKDVTKANLPPILDSIIRPPALSETEIGLEKYLPPTVTNNSGIKTRVDTEESSQAGSEEENKEPIPDMSTPTSKTSESIQEFASKEDKKASNPEKKISEEKQNQKGDITKLSKVTTDVSSTTGSSQIKPKLNSDEESGESMPVSVSDETKNKIQDKPEEESGESSPEMKPTISNTEEKTIDTGDITKLSEISASVPTSTTSNSLVFKEDSEESKAEIAPLSVSEATTSTSSENTSATDEIPNKAEVTTKLPEVTSSIMTFISEGMEVTVGTLDKEISKLESLATRLGGDSVVTSVMSATPKAEIPIIESIDPKITFLAFDSDEEKNVIKEESKTQMNLASDLTSTNTRELMFDTPTDDTTNDDDPSAKKKHFNFTVSLPANQSIMSLTVVFKGDCEPEPRKARCRLMSQNALSPTASSARRSRSFACFEV